MRNWHTTTILLLVGVTPWAPSLGGWQTFETSDGLIANSVLCIAVDGAGDYWFGTDGGVSRYDGLIWQSYTTAHGLVDNEVRAILKDHTGNLWFGTRRGVSQYDGAGWRSFTVADGLPDDEVWSVCEDDAGNLWFGTNGGLSRYDGVDWESFTVAEGLAGNIVPAILEDHEGILWIGTNGGVSRFDGSSWRSFTTADGLPGNVVYSIIEDHSGVLWFGTGGGICRYDRTSLTFAPFSSPGGEFFRIVEDRRGNLWFATWGSGARLYDGTRWRTFTRADGLADYDVLAIFEDPLGNLWFGTGLGVSRYDGAGWKTYTTEDGLPDNHASVIMQDRHGSYWLGGSFGATCFDGESWRIYTTADGLASNFVLRILEDREGNYWFGTWGSGVTRYDGTSWQTFTKEDRYLRDNYIWAILEDRNGRVWFGTEGGVTRYAPLDTFPRNWRTFTTADGLVDDNVSALVEDHDGNLWIGTKYRGVSRYDGTTWTTFTVADGLADNRVAAIFEDRAGLLWFGTGNGLSRYDGTRWRTYTQADGLADNSVTVIVEDRSGNLWCGGQVSGVSRFDGTEWRTYRTADGLAGDYISSIIEDRAGSLWFATEGGVSVHDRDLVPPKTAFLHEPSSPSGSRQVEISFTAAFGEGQTEFSWSLDDDPWSLWSPVNSYRRAAVADGIHVFRVRAGDRDGNVEQAPATSMFELDATPPGPMIVSPSYGQVVRDSLTIIGRASDARFVEYRVEVLPAGSSVGDTVSAVMLVRRNAPVSGGPLAGWNTSLLPDGYYQLRLSVLDDLGLTGTAITEVLVDNHAPWAEVTSPARVGSGTGGDVYSGSGDFRVYFPPHAFQRDVVVTIDPTSADSVPQTLPSGALRVLPGHGISWNGAVLAKQATLELSLANVDMATLPGSLALYIFSDDAMWRRLGGTVHAGARRICLAISEPGRYALFVDESTGSDGSALASLSLTPRVFSPTGGFANDEVAISFTLGRAGPVQVRIYNRAGRAVRHLLTGQSLRVGANLVHWDGREDDGRIVSDGVYLVTIEGPDQRETKTLAVVR